MSGAVLSALLGLAVVGANGATTLLVTRATSRASRRTAAAALAATYLAKVLLLGWVVLVVPAPPWLSSRWFAASVLLGVVVWLVLAGRAGARGSGAATVLLLEQRRAERDRQDATTGEADGKEHDHEQE